MYIFDGEIHALSDQWAYMAFKAYEDEGIFECHKIIDGYLENYANYLYENDKDKVISYLMETLRSQVASQCTDSNYQVIFRPAYKVNGLKQDWEVALKFRRSREDKLAANPKTNECDH